MDQPTAPRNKSTLPNHSVGLYSEKMDEINIPRSVFKFIHNKKEAPIPKSTIGKCQTMREHILQVSLFPDIYDKRANIGHPGNIDFGEKD